jgi:hypothetical protein
LQQHLSWWADLLDLPEHKAVPPECTVLSQQFHIRSLTPDPQAHATFVPSTYAMPEIVLQQIDMRELRPNKIL